MTSAFATLSLLLTSLAPLHQSSISTAGMVANSPEEARPIGVGATVPEVTIRDIKGRWTQLSRVLSGKPTVLIFYRGGWCPYCNAHLAGLQVVDGDLRSMGYQIVAISPDTPSELNKTLDLHHLTYRLLSDSKADALKAFGVAWHVPDPMVETMKTKYGVDLEKASGEKDHILPVPSVFIIGRDKKIHYAYSNPDYKVRLEPAKIVEEARNALK